MPDPFDKLLTRFGENAILVVVVMAVCGFAFRSGAVHHCRALGLPGLAR